MNIKEIMACSKCSSKMFVDRVFLTHDHIELYCLKCGRREMYHHPQNFGERIRWIMAAEKRRARIAGNPL
jgi:hypothetical protein